MVDVYVLNKEERTANNGWSSSFGAEKNLITLQCKQLLHFKILHRTLDLFWTGKIGRFLST